jgi:hypothetical protein
MWEGGAGNVWGQGVLGICGSNVHGVAWCGMVMHQVWHGVAWGGMVWHGGASSVGAMMLHGDAW